MGEGSDGDVIFGTEVRREGGGGFEDGGERRGAEFRGGEGGFGFGGFGFAVWSRVS